MKGDVNLKKLIAVIIALILSFNAIFINAFKVGAMMAGPATANALEAFIEAVLAATGAASSSQLDSLDFNQKQTILTDGLNSGSIPQNDFLNYVSDPGLLVAKGLIENSDDLFLVQNVFADAFYDWWYDTFHNKDLSKVLMPTIDLQGYGAVIYSKDSRSKYGHWYYCDYAEIYYDDHGNKCFICYNCKSVSEMTGSVEYLSSTSRQFYDSYAYSLSGDIRMRDTGELASDDEDYVDASPSADTVVGTLDDGTEVTAGDIISGAVDPSKVRPNYDVFIPDVLTSLIDSLLDVINSLIKQKEDIDKEIDEAADSFYDEELKEKINSITDENIADTVSAVRQVADTIPFYSDIKSILPRLFNILTPNTPPKDITITINLRPLADFEKTYTLVKYSWFTDGGFSDGISIVRNFATLLVSIFLLLKIAKRLIGFFGGVTDYYDHQQDLANR